MRSIIFYYCLKKYAAHLSFLSIYHCLKEDSRHLIRRRRLTWKIVAINTPRRRYRQDRWDNRVVVCLAIRLHNTAEEWQHYVTRTIEISSTLWIHVVLDMNVAQFLDCFLVTKKDLINSLWNFSGHTSERIRIEINTKRLQSQPQ